MTIVPCEKNTVLRDKIEAFAEVLKTQAHLLGAHGLSEREFYDSGLFRGAIERLRGQFAASMKEKRDFAAAVLEDLKQRKFIADWRSASEANRHDYVVDLNSGRVAAIELKGCLDGNNTNIFDRPANANEFVVWSVCTNPGADPRLNVWSGIHTRLSAEIISREIVIDGLIVWDMVCGTLGRPCPKLKDPARANQIGPYLAPPPCPYLFPATVPSPRNNAHPKAQSLDKVELVRAFHDAFRGTPEEVHQVDFSVEYRGAEIVRTTWISRGGEVLRESAATAIQRV
jgi:hypothetical protein